MEHLKENYKISEEKLADLKLSLIVAKGYVNKLLNNVVTPEFLGNDIYHALKEVCEK